VAGFHTFVELPLGLMLLWLGLAALTGGLIALMRSRWGRSRPLRNYVILSLLAHVLLAAFATTIRIAATVQGSSDSPATRVTIVTDAAQPAAGTTNHAWKPWEVLAHEPIEADSLDRSFGDRFPFAGRSSATDSAQSVGQFLAERSRPMEPDPPRLAEFDTLPAVPTPPPLPAAPIAASTAITQNTTGDPAASVPSNGNAALTRTRSTSVDSPPPAGDHRSEQEQVDPLDEQARHPAERRETQGGQERPIVPIPVPVPVASSLAKDAENGEDSTHRELPATLPSVTSSPKAMNVPSTYRNRFAPDRAQIVAANGGDAETEAAVEAALRWLANNQAADGRWDADQHGAGREQTVLGHDRQGAGFRADTGITGLALLALLGAGHTQLAGPYRDHVARGIAFLSQSQRRDGSLGGTASLYAHMYCHAMATFALSEAYATTHAPALDHPVRRAVAYSIASQHPRSGGWRYQSGDPGDTSQLGWQVMALRSAELAGIEIPAETRRGMRRFLRSVAAGTYGGLASYQPRSRPSRTMTAEALACRQLLETVRDRQAEQEAVGYLLTRLPGQGQPNLYYWYYGTLSLYQVRGDAWRKWNDALKATLLAAQRTNGPQAGSWDPQTMWGGYGGRVYSTAMAALSLEIYYRYLPLYIETARLNRWQR